VIEASEICPGTIYADRPVACRWRLSGRRRQRHQQCAGRRRRCRPGADFGSWRLRRVNFTEARPESVAASSASSAANHLKPASPGEVARLDACSTCRHRCHDQQQRDLRSYIPIDRSAYFPSASLYWTRRLPTVRSAKPLAERASKRCRPASRTDRHRSWLAGNAECHEWRTSSGMRRKVPSWWPAASETAPSSKRRTRPRQIRRTRA